MRNNSIDKISKNCNLKLSCDVFFDNCENNSIILVLIRQHQFDFIYDDHQIVDEKLQITLENSMHIFEAKCNDDVEMKNFIDDVFAKTFELKLKSNLSNIFNIVMMKIMLFIFDDKNVSNFGINFVCKDIDDGMSHVIKLLSTFFRVK